ncbi:uncharacterized protein LOC108632069 isoform X2 [Ceratina calcarata]|uniref:Uncharacterized protein LOC108632069 isoform X2 n=1 Tax=Ceratina calcarata TaxID=156304 RepID=A0AAJ7SBT4_9HYME|nr:uncharacterized protein LOC108632069 isoform X2 [Ceratina calcarata]
MRSDRGSVNGSGACTSTCKPPVRYRGYKDRILRNRCYDTLVHKLREVNPLADRETVIRKINTLRTAFRREYKKVRSSEWTVQDPRHRYKSSLWYYDLLKFVAEQNETCPVDDGGGDANNTAAHPAELSQDEILPVQTDVNKMEPPSPVPSLEVVPPFQPIILETEGSYAERGSPDSLGRNYNHRESTFQDHQTTEQSHELSPRHFASCVTDDDFETFGRYVAGKLRKSMLRQSIIAEKIIADVLLRANLGTLEETTCLTEKVPSRCFLIMDDR